MCDALSVLEDSFDDIGGELLSSTSTMLRDAVLARGGGNSPDHMACWSHFFSEAGLDWFP